MTIRAQFVRFFAAALFVPSCVAQTGTVTFYSFASSARQQLKSAVAPVGTGSFTGWLYDGDRRVAHASRGRFMTFQLAAGTHDFSVSYKSNLPAKLPLHILHLNVEGGGHYCVRLSARYVSPIVVPVAYANGRIEQIPCRKAVEEAGSYKRIDLKRVEPALQMELDTSYTFPREN